MAQGPNQLKATCFWKLSFIVTHICTGAEAELPNDGASLGFFLTVVVQSHSIDFP